MSLLLLDLDNGVGLFLAGLLAGITIGSSWEHAYELIRSGIRERRARRKEGGGTVNPFSRISRWFRSLGVVGTVLLLNCLVWALIGVFQVYTYTHLRAFVKCQADYNQKSAIARDSRVGVTDRETNLLFNALRDNITAAEQLQKVPPSKQEAEADRLQKHLLKEFHRAVDAHQERIHAAKVHPFPPNPTTTCGGY